MSAPSTSLMQELKKQELIAQDKARAAAMLKNILASLASSEVSRVETTKKVSGN